MLLPTLIIQDEILHLSFTCDLSVCRGACCTAPGGRGAPITEEEASLATDAYPVIRHLLPDAHRAIIDRDGCFERSGGTLALRCHNQRACVFVMIQDGIALCSIQHAYKQGLLAWPKPLSCHLFPIRRSGAQGRVLKLEFFDECASGIAKGVSTNVALTDYLAEPLERAFGVEQTDELRHRARVAREDRKG